ncbi:MAG: hypothetical protein ACK493_00630, partial [Planctomycetota bacterium]
FREAVFREAVFREAVCREAGPSCLFGRVTTEVGLAAANGNRGLILPFARQVVFPVRCLALTLSGQG